TTVDASQRRAHLGIYESSGHEQRELEMDVTAVMALLPPEQRAVCALLRTKTPTEISRETGLSRSALYKHIAAIRAAFIKAGLDHYL
ncbi:MAG: RNA polymerase subunit sigma-24, partial [Phycisphaerae bacterium]|nr:RNA polymerase subunit sigma-24 [Phycisphaerae bacterium]